MNDDKRQAKIADIRNKLGLPPRVDPPRVDEGPYEADTTEETDTTDQAADSTPRDLINIDSDNDNENDDEDQYDINADTKDDGEVEDDNTLHPRTVRKQGCEEHEEESLFSENSDDDHGDHYSESSNGESKKNWN